MFDLDSVNNWMTDQFNTDTVITDEHKNVPPDSAIGKTVDLSATFGGNMQKGWNEIIADTTLENYVPDYTRVARVIAKAKSGKTVKIAVLGDSIGTFRNWTEAYYRQWFYIMFGSENIEFLNASIGCNTLRFLNWRVNEDLIKDKAPDLVAFSSWTYHDPNLDSLALESIVKRLLEQDIAVISVIFPCTMATQFTEDDAYLGDLGYKYDGDYGKWTNKSSIMEDALKYYSIPIVSYGNALEKTEKKYFSRLTAGFGRFGFTDMVHPSKFGEKIVGLGICSQLNYVAQNLDSILSTSSASLPKVPYYTNGWSYTDAELYDRNDSDKYTVTKITGVVTDYTSKVGVHTWNGWKIEADSSITFKLSHAEIMEMIFNFDEAQNGDAGITIKDSNGNILTDTVSETGGATIGAWASSGGKQSSPTAKIGSLLFANKEENITVTVTASSGKPVKLFALAVAGLK